MGTIFSDCYVWRLEKRSKWNSHKNRGKLVYTTDTAWSHLPLPQLFVPSILSLYTCGFQKQFSHTAHNSNIFYTTGKNTILVAGRHPIKLTAISYDKNGTEAAMKPRRALAGRYYSERNYILIPSALQLLTITAENSVFNHLRR